MGLLRLGSRGEGVTDGEASHGEQRSDVQVDLTSGRVVGAPCPRRERRGEAGVPAWYVLSYMSSSTCP